LFITKLRTILSDINREVENIVFSDKAIYLTVLHLIEQSKMNER